MLHPKHTHHQLRDLSSTFLNHAAGAAAFLSAVNLVKVDLDMPLRPDLDAGLVKTRALSVKIMFPNLLGVFFYLFFFFHIRIYKLNKKQVN